MASHGKLQRPLAVEVILEIQFQASLKLSSYIEKLGKSVRATYPGREATNLFGLEVQVGSEGSGGVPKIQQVNGEQNMPHLPRYRFTGYNGFAFQVGEGIVSIHTTFYQGFNEFMAEAKNVLRRHQLDAVVKEYTGARLRYLNLIPTGDQGIDPRQYLSWGLELPELSVVYMPGSNTQQALWNFEDGDSERVTLAVPQRLGDRIGLVIDIEHTVATHKISGKKLDSLDVWSNTAHEHVWETFVNTLRPEYLEELRNATLSD